MSTLAFTIAWTARRRLHGQIETDVVVAGRVHRQHDGKTVGVSSSHVGIGNRLSCRRSRIAVVEKSVTAKVATRLPAAVHAMGSFAPLPDCGAPTTHELTLGMGWVPR